MNYRVGISALLAVSLLGACGNSEDTSKKEESTPKTEVSKDDGTTVVDGIKLKEPAKDEVCAFCNMKAYAKSDDMGAFTAQAVDAKGKNLFFDDAGCMLNYERKHKVTLDKFVRNYDDKSWMKLDDAIVVKGDIKTPMKYGFAYFGTKEAAESFIKEHKEAKIVKASDIDDVSHERFSKMGDMKHDEHKGHDEHEGHDEHGDHDKEHDDNSGH